MAIAHINFNQGTQHGLLLKNGLQKLEDSLGELNEIKGTMQLMIDGDGSLAAHFTYMTGKFGFTDDAGAKAAWDELNSLLFKLNTDSSVDNVHAALVQAFNKFR